MSRRVDATPCTAQLSGCAPRELESRIAEELTTRPWFDLAAPVWWGDASFDADKIRGRIETRYLNGDIDNPSYRAALRETEKRTPVIWIRMHPAHANLVVDWLAALDRNLPRTMKAKLELTAGGQTAGLLLRYRNPTEYSAALQALLQSLLDMPV